MTMFFAQVRQFQYAGELRRSGRLANLQLRVAQDGLAPSVIASAREEIDTQYRRMRLIAQLEDCISFILSVGGNAVAGIDGHTPIREYALSVLRISPKDWATLSCATVDQHVQLRHMQALFLGLQVRPVCECNRPLEAVPWAGDPPHSWPRRMKRRRTCSVQCTPCTESR